MDSVVRSGNWPGRRGAGSRPAANSLALGSRQRGMEYGWSTLHKTICNRSIVQSPRTHSVLACALATSMLIMQISSVAESRRKDVLHRVLRFTKESKEYKL